MSNENGITIPIRGINNFCGLFGMPDEPRALESFPQTFGVSLARDKELFFISKRPMSGFPSHARAFPISEEGKRMGMSFVAEASLPQIPIVMCCEFGFMQFLMDNKPLESLPSDPPDFGPDARAMNLMVLPDDFTRCYLQVLKSAQFTAEDAACFLSWVAVDINTFNFLRLPSMAHSLIDIINFLRRDQPMDAVLAAFDGGAEWFTLTRTERTPSKIDFSELELIYSGTVQSYSHLPEPYRIKLAVIATCKKYELGLGYMVHWSNENSSRSDPGK